jgi:hypothetical protein
MKVLTVFTVGTKRPEQTRMTVIHVSDRITNCATQQDRFYGLQKLSQALFCALRQGMSVIFE